MLDEPAPMVVFTGFGDSALEFELRAFIPSIDDYIAVWDGVNTAIDQAFRKASIVIAFPQRDLHVKSVEQAFPIADQRQEK